MRWEKFQSNPYYFFFGNILRGHIQYKLDLLGGLAFSRRTNTASG